ASWWRSKRSMEERGSAPWPDCAKRNSRQIPSRVACLCSAAGVEPRSASWSMMGKDSGWRRSGCRKGGLWALGGGHDLPLRDLIHRVDMVDALAGGRIALMHGVHPQVARLALRIGTAPLADGHRGGPRPGVGETAFPIARLLPQVIEVRHRNRRQPLILGLAVLAAFPLP